MSIELTARLKLRTFDLEDRELRAWTPDPRGRGLWLWDDRGVGALVDPVHGERLLQTQTLHRGARIKGTLKVAWVDGERVLLARDLDGRKRGLGHEVVLWSTSLGEELWALTWPLGSRVYAMNPDAGLCAVATGTTTRELCSLEDGRTIAEIERGWPLELGPTRCLWIAQGNSRAWTLRALDLKTLEIRTLATGMRMCRSLTTLASGHILLGTTHHWLLIDPDTGETLATRGLETEPTCRERRLAAHDAGTLTLASATVIERWHPETLDTLEAPTELQEPLGVSAERAELLGDALVIEGPVGNLHVWSALTGASLRGRPLPNRRAETCVASRDGAYLRMMYPRTSLDLEVATGWAPTAPPDFGPSLSRPPGFGIRTARSPNGRYVCDIREDYEEDGYYSSIDVFYVTLTDVVDDVELYSSYERNTYRDLDVLYVSDAGEVLFRWNRRELVWWGAGEATVTQTIACPLHGPLYLHEARRIIELTLRPNRALRVLDADTCEELVSWRVPGVTKAGRTERLLAASEDARWAIVVNGTLATVWDLTSGDSQVVSAYGEVHAGCLVPGERKAYLVCEGHEVVTVTW